MPTNQDVADGGRSTFTVQNNRDFPATAIGVFSARQNPTALQPTKSAEE